MKVSFVIPCYCSEKTIGKVVDEESMQVVLDISKVPTTTFYHFHDFPVEPVIISEVVRID